jgi:hypothetical protein
MRQPNKEVTTGLEPLVKKVVVILSAALLPWAGYHIYTTASAEKHHGLTRPPETVAQLDGSRELLEKEKRDNEESDSPQRMMRERVAMEQRDEIGFGR